MLAHAHGGLVCQLSGGCPQRVIVMQMIANALLRLVRYNAESGLDALMEVGGGEL